MATPIQFTQEQARVIATVSPGETRQWRKVVPYLASKPGKASRFAFSDLVALTITGALTRDMGVRISEVALGVDSLFERLAAARPTNLEGLVAVVWRQRTTLVRVGDFRPHDMVEPAFLMSCDAVIADIRARMLPVTMNDQQAPLPFTPVSVGTRS